MNRTNNTMLTSPNLSYTSRDFTSIYEELLSSIPLLTKSWDAKDENDPGVVLLKAISMIGDMLSYNQDKQALEVFPRTVIQRANAQQIFRLIGYKMHWWRSAIVNANFTNSNSFPINIGRYNIFTTVDKKISYTNLTELTIPAGAYGDSAYTSELIQGIPFTPNRKIGGSINANAEWHESYDYNIDATRINNNKIYLSHTNVDENSITLIDNDETPFAINEWKLVKNINLSETMDKFFEFDVSENGKPFILLPNYWMTKYVITKFKLFYVLSDGKNGEIEENKLSIIDSSKCSTTQEGINMTTVLQQVNIFNSASTYGYNPETCVEARKESEKYQNTIDTLVILKDFEKAVRRIDSVANVIATDVQIDPNRSEMSNYDINLWIIRKNDYNNLGENYIYADKESVEQQDELFRESVIGELKSYKLMPYNININLENKIDWIDWTVTGQIFLRRPISINENYDLMVKINNNLKNRFNTETLDFNEAVNYMDVIECIMKTDRNIWHVDLDTSAIQYSRVKRSLKGNKLGMSIKNKYMIYDENNNYTGYYMSSFGCTNIYINKIQPFVQTDESLKYVLNYVIVELEDGSKQIIARPIDDNNDNVADSEAITKIMDSYDENGYLASTDSYNMIKTVDVISEDSITPGGSGYGKNIGNKIIREDGLETVVGVDFGRPDEPREYEVYNNHIIDWTGYEPISTNRFIDTSTVPFKIKKYNDIGELVDTGYTIQYDSRMYLEDGSDAHRCFKLNKRKIFNNDEERDVYDIMDTRYNIQTDESWIGESVDILTGEIFILRGNYWYSTNRSYDEETGEFLDTFGSVQYVNNMTVREEACREDITGQYVQEFDMQQYWENNPDKAESRRVEIYLGQDANGNPTRNSIGNVIQAYPIKPYSMYLYVNGDEDIIADNGSGKLSSTPGLLNGWGTIDYDTGLITFTSNVDITSLKIMYTVNKFTYSHYVNFDTSKFFINPQYIRSDNRK